MCLFRGITMKKKMLCPECVKKIKPFIEHKLDATDTLAFVHHTNECAECKEELSIEFLVVHGLRKLDSAEAFDLQRELNELIESSIEKANKHKRIYREIMLFAIFAAIVLGYFIASLLY